MYVHIELIVGIPPLFMLSTYDWHKLANASPVIWTPLTTLGPIEFMILYLSSSTCCINSCLRSLLSKSSNFCKSLSSSTGLINVKQSLLGKNLRIVFLIWSLLREILLSVDVNIALESWLSLMSSSSRKACSRYSYKR